MVRRVSLPEPLLLEAVTIRLIQNSEWERFDEELVTKHYLKNANAVGRVLRYVAEYRDQWVALLVFCSPAFHIKLRDQWLHWLPRQVKERRNLIAQNARFLVLAARPVAQSGLAVLKLAGERLAADYQEHFGYPVLVLETFVDPQRFRGTCYQAAGWQPLGADPRLRTGLAGLLHRYPASQATVKYGPWERRLPSKPGRRSCPWLWPTRKVPCRQPVLCPRPGWTRCGSAVISK